MASMSRRPGTCQLPVEVTLAEAQRFHRSEQERASGPDRGLRKDREERARDGLVLRVGARDPLHGNPAGLQRLPHQSKVLGGIQVPRSGVDRQDDVGVITS